MIAAVSARKGIDRNEARLRGPRIGRADVLAADRAPVQTRLGLVAPPRDLDQIAAKALAEAASLARLTQLIGSLGRRIRRDGERRARLHALHDRAIVLWYELAGLAQEVQRRSKGDPR
jgi:hypothetical protein